MAVPIVDWNGMPRGGTGLEAATRRHWERQKQEARERLAMMEQLEAGEDEEAKAAKRGSADSSESNSSSNDGKSGEKRRSFWKSLKGGKKSDSNGSSS
ncbi:hypothetical protein ASPWEDRAFT_46496 [Aspergillus wentii DTO 134E9]|uniref:Uncharacterized protein n=1 Tax=Aspergillus wentii DTO 134E9 TaxID=1073089 RepID=A0A1L9R495_ASPWE|nr:uncharacterized protein ASPWEDRAFT_46496 [Aspergillus wentii DTO 134E9]KAI9927034.1 hypothetical protein MW887_003415 [Aspergillus wentii]OJJ29751.1 hypothetical protein ASPWEDRAFT_46496 [Aspergillus wentii DTO 134E9]